jgi:hypothetical protein
VTKEYQKKKIALTDIDMMPAAGPRRLGRAVGRSMTRR